jgi:hypothetical protein
MSLVPACSSGKVAAGLDRLADLAVHGLDRVGGVDDAAQLVGQRQERRDVLRVAPPGLGDHRVAPAPLLVEALELGLGGVGGGGGVDRLERCRDLAPVLADSRIGGHGPAQAVAGPTGRVRNGMGA